MYQYIRSFFFLEILLLGPSVSLSLDQLYHTIVWLLIFSCPRILFASFMCYIHFLDPKLPF